MFGLSVKDMVIGGVATVGTGLGVFNTIKGHSLKKRVNNLDTFLSYDSKSAAVKVTAAAAPAAPAPDAAQPAAAPAV